MWKLKALDQPRDVNESQPDGANDVSMMDRSSRSAESVIELSFAKTSKNRLKYSHCQSTNS